MHYEGMWMRKLIFLALVFITLVGCDQKPIQPTVQQEKKAEYEEYKFDCSSNNRRVECNVVAGDLLGSGKWHHAKIYMYSGEVDANIDGSHYIKTDFRTSFYEGNKYNTFELKASDKSYAEVTIVDDKDGMKLTLEAWDKDGKRFISAYQR